MFDLVLAAMLESLSTLLSLSVCLLVQPRQSLVLLRLCYCLKLCCCRQPVSGLQKAPCAALLDLLFPTHPKTCKHTVLDVAR